MNKWVRETPKSQNSLYPSRPYLSFLSLDPSLSHFLPLQPSENTTSDHHLTTPLSPIDADRLNWRKERFGA
ncbi:hypothetical protein RchiOBHm_Chr2g0122321 [Rosa chinensis]|uniref:Uncharacterized protein n=1 Tax=Rosa chinensis TaxID=74649 RepID=A0A2P6RSS0_ROSCH|nr:hypothetical protein RchiOBHm_Chr2g0122321 [Rosa chinensis]